MKDIFNENRKYFNENQIEDVLNNYEDLKEKFKKESKLKKFLGEFKMLFGLFRDYTTGNYKAVPWYVIAAIGSTLLYVLSPIDAIPDFIPFFGYVDDAAVMALCLKFVSLEIDKYKKWKFNKS